ncbi:MAG: TraR/DksA family transcriptional regulator [Acidimicrobiales bacterium]|nr:TraR/DksA family transcriptional regulator [Acidimicrobiales bacterium]
MDRGPDASHLDLESVRARLTAAREETVQQLSSLTRDFDDIVAGSEHVNTDDEHDPEGATVAFERAQVAALRASAQRRLAALDDALRRLDEGTYGVCTVCGRPIGAERLAAVPGTDTCVDCVGRAPRQPTPQHGGTP